MIATIGASVATAILHYNFYMDSISRGRRKTQKFVMVKDPLLYERKAKLPDHEQAEGEKSKTTGHVLIGRNVTVDAGSASAEA